MSVLDFYLFIFWIFLISYVSYSTSDNASGLHSYIPQDDDFGSNSQRFQQIMQGASNTKWREPKLKLDKIDVKTELKNLNITYVYESKWPNQSKILGSVTAVSFDKNGNVVIFHRGEVIWTQDSFDVKNIYKEKYRTPIQNNTIITFDRKTGEILYEWGKNIFYMPHGLTIDHDDNIWITDVALHQIMKFGPKGSNNKPLMVLGTAFQPGKSNNKFCKPTSIAVLPEGEFFVADGYCNARIMKFSKNGELMLQWGQNSFQGDAYEIAPKNFFAIPHALTLINDKELLCVADRENGRVQCFYTINGTFHSQYHNEIIGDRLFSIDYSSINGGQLFVVNGPTALFDNKNDHYNEVNGFVIDMKTKQVLSKFGPNNTVFSNPHDIAVTSDGNEVYVAELNPCRIHKFIHKNIFKNKSLSISTIKLTNSINNGTYVNISSINSNSISDNTTKLTTTTQSSSKALLIILLIIVFSLLGLGLALLISRQRKRGLLNTYSTNYLIFSNAE